jgi:hypothetical protein
MPNVVSHDLLFPTSLQCAYNNEARTTIIQRVLDWHASLRPYCSYLICNEALSPVNAFTSCLVKNSWAF